MEIDFLISSGKKIVPIEVKSSRAKNHASLDKFVKKFKGRYEAPCVLCTKDVLEEEGILYLPMYMAMFL